MKPFALIMALVASVTCVIAVPASGNLNNGPTVDIVNDTPIVKDTDATPSVQVVNQAATVEVFNNSTQRALDIRSAQAAGTISVKLGSTRSHIGTVRGSDAYGFMFRALESLCHQGNGQCCEVGNPQCVKLFKMKGAEGERGSRGSYGDINILIHVVNSGWDKSHGIWKLMMFVAMSSGTIAGIFEQATLQPNNCHHIATGDHTYCNSGDFIGVTVPGGKDTNGKPSILEIFIRTDGWQSNKFDCVGLLTPANRVVDGLKGEYEMWLDKRPLDRNVYCV